MPSIKKVFALTLFCTYVLAAVHTFDFTAHLVRANPDGEFTRNVIGINGQWPLPTIRVKLGDQVRINLTNGMDDRNVSLHYHGLFMNGSNSMDGPEGVTQCPIPPRASFLYDFVVNQTGTYWYHSHSGAQYSDGLRGVFIVEEPTKDEYPFHFDEDVSLTVGDHYHLESHEIMKKFKSRFNPSGAEPIPQNSLFNESRGVTWNVLPDTTYYLRVINMGMFVSQYVYIEDHELVIVEIDGVYVEPRTVDSLYIGVAQRYGVLVKTKSNPSQDSFRFVNVIDRPMLDLVPSDLKLITTNYVNYPNATTQPDALVNDKYSFDHLIAKLNPVDDFTLTPLEKKTLYNDADYQIVLNFTMEQLGDGVTYAFLNDQTYTAPKVPSLYTVFSSGDLANNAAIYGSNTNSFVLLYGETVEIVLNNMDPGLHPFHLHGHVFQLISRSEGTEDEENPQVYDPSNAEHTQFPEYPMMRDTVMVNANGFMVLRFKADNPGVWFFHCHVDWHLEQGLAITLIEAPHELQQQQNVTEASHYKACKIANIPIVGNAAGRSGRREEWLDLTGENVQFPPLPEGFTTKGYIAFFACTIAAIFGVFSIYQYGLEDVNTDNAEHIIQKLYEILEKYDSEESSAMLRNQAITN